MNVFWSGSLGSKVIVVMSCHNNAGTLPACLESLRAQSFADWVLLAADDGSSDETPDILQAASERDSRIQPFIYPDNQGLAARLNALIESALTDYPGAFIARMDGDDICASDRFEKQVSFLNQNPDIGVLGSWGRCINADGTPSSQTVETATTHDQIAVNGFFSAPLLHPSVMMRPSILTQLVYDTGLRRAQDFDLWARLVPFTKFAVLPDYLLTYRLGSDKRINKEEDLNRFRRIIVGRNLARLGLADQGAEWMAAAYALVGFPLPQAAVQPYFLAQVFQDLLSANARAGLYNDVLFAEKLRKKYEKARRKNRWWRRALRALFGRS